MTIDSYFTQQILNKFPTPMVLIDTNYKIIITNQAYNKRYPQQSNQTNQRCYEVSHHYSVPCDQAGELCPLKEGIENNSPQRVLHLHHTSFGQEHVDIELLPIYKQTNELSGFLEILPHLNDEQNKITYGI